jgi:hypothetical protein
VTEIPDGLARYFALRQQQRDAEVNQVLARMTERERRLVREAAVMGYVRGALAAAGGRPAPPIPPDSAVVADVVSACLTMSDLYPVIAALGSTEAPE